MKTEITLPKPPELPKEVNSLSLSAILATTREVVEFLEATQLAIANAEITLRELRRQVKAIEDEAIVDLNEELKKEGVKSNEELRSAMLGMRLRANVHHVAQSAKEAELEADLIRAKALQFSYMEYLKWYKDCLSVFNYIRREFAA